MGNRNYGPGVSEYLDPTGRNFEEVIFQAGKPLVDAELNLCEELLGGPRAFSGWFAPEVLQEIGNVFFVSSTSNTLVASAQTVNVNGWNLLIDKTGADTANVLTFPAAPVGAGTHRVDIVILECWRRLLSPNPDGTGKSPTNRIWLNGNVKTFDPAAPGPLDPVDLNNNLLDDMLDPRVGTETTKRVQIQYRLRVVSNVDLFAYPNGLDDPSISVNRVPVTATAPDGVLISGMRYDPMLGDSGMWRAGDGNPANALGTVDGYMYAVPFFAVFRRNSTAFAKNTNHNGAGTSPALSGRPDGLFNNIFVESDIADLRMCISKQGWDYAELLEKNVGLVFDNGLCTEWVATDRGGSTWGHTVLYASEIGVSTINGGDGNLTGSTPGAAFIGEFDRVRRDFSDRAVLEVATIRIPCPGPPGSVWSHGQVVEIDPAGVAVWPDPAFAWFSYNPGVITFVDVVRSQYMGWAVSQQSSPATFSQVVGLGLRPQTALHLTLGSIPLGVTSEDLMVDVLVVYPQGHGLTKTPTLDFGDASFVINNPTQMPTYDIFVHRLDHPHREAHLQYVTNILTLSLSAAGFVSPLVVMPDRVFDVDSVTVNTVPVALSSISDDRRTLTLATPTNPGDTLVVNYRSIRPMPQNNEQICIYYDYRAPQTMREWCLPSSLSVLPRSIASSLYSMTVGSGSQDEAYPYPVGFAQAGGVKTASGDPAFSGDYELLARSHISITDFDADTGLLKLPTFIGVAVPPTTFMLTRGVLDVDIEARTYYSNAMEGTGPDAYQLNAYAQDLSELKRHKVVLPMLIEMPGTTQAGKTGQLALMLLTRWANFDANNGVYFDSNPTANTTTASIYRLRGNILNGRL